MVMRLLLLLALVAGCAAQAADWSGTFEVVETVAGPAPAASERKEIEESARSLEARLARARGALKTANPVVARIHRRDIGQLEAELESLALERGGTVTLGRIAYAVRGERVAADGDEARVIADGAAGTAVVVGPGRSDRVALVRTPAKAPADNTPSEPIAGVATLRGTITIGGDPCTVIWAPELPNVYALTRIPAHGSDSLHVALAGLPGLPLAAERRTARGIQRWTVQKLTPGAVDDRLFAE